MIWTIVVGAAADGDGKFVSPMISENQKVCRGLGTAVGAAGMDGSLLGKEEIGTVDRKISVNFIGGYLMVTGDPVFTTCIHQYGSTDDVCAQEDLRIFNRTVYMGLSCEIDDDIRLFLFKKMIDALAVTDIHLDEAEIGAVHHWSQCGKISCVCQFVYAYEAILGMLLQLIKDKVASDKSGATGHDNIHN
jgi:hypothetical protein